MSQMVHKTLTGDDLALAEQAAALAIAWSKAKLGKGSFKREQIAKFTGLIAKLSAISDHAYPYRHSDDMGPEVGRERIMRLDVDVARKTRATAKSRSA